MNFEEFKAEVIKIHEEHGLDWALPWCKDLISQIDLSEEEIALFDGPIELADGSYACSSHDMWWTKYCRSRRYKKWMKELKEERIAAGKRHDERKQAEWDAKSPEEKAAIKEEERKFQEKCHAATAAALDRYYEDAARTGRYTGD